MVGPVVFVALILLLSLTDQKPKEEKKPPVQMSEAELGNAIAHVLVDMQKKQVCK